MRILLEFLQAVIRRTTAEKGSFHYERIIISSVITGIEACARGQRLRSNYVAYECINGNNLLAE